LSFDKINYNSSGEVFNIKIEDTSGRLLDKWKFMAKDFAKWVNIIANKYGISLKPKKDKDLDWTNY